MVVTGLYNDPLCFYNKSSIVHGTYLGFRVTGAPLGEGDLPLDDFLDAVMNGEQPSQLFIENWVISKERWEDDVAEDWRRLRESTETLRARLAARAARS